MCRNIVSLYQKSTLKQFNNSPLTPPPAKKTNKQTKQKTKLLNVPRLKINKSELKTNETLITQVTNALFYQVDKNRLQKKKKKKKKNRRQQNLTQWGVIITNNMNDFPLQ